MYSLGGTLFHAIAGRPPFEADTASMVALKHLKSKAVSLQAFAPDVSSATAYVINRTLNKDPDQRYQTYTEMIEHLEYARAQLSDAGGGPRKARQRVVVAGASQQKAAGIITLVMILFLLGVGAGIYIYRDRVFGIHHDTVAATVAEDPDAAIKRLHQQFDAARKQVVTGDYAGARDSLQKLADDDLITQPMQNWVTVNQGLNSLLQENTTDARGWFKVVQDRSHFSNDASDTALVTFFSSIGGSLSTAAAIPAATGGKYASDSYEALAPLLFALKDWSLGKYADAGKLFTQYLNSAPKDPFQWIADYKPIAQKYADQEAAFDKASAASAAADTPDKRAAALKQALEAGAKGKMAARVKKLEQDIKKKSAQLDATYYERIADAKQREEGLLADAKRVYAADCVEFRFDEARAAIAAVNVTGPDALQEKAAQLKKADWLRQFKAQLIQDINVYGYSGSIANRQGGQVPDGVKKATADALTVQTQFGPLTFAWNTLPASALVAMAGSFSQSVAATAPQQAADRQWLCGVFACEEGLTNQGDLLLAQASQTKPEYKAELALFPGAEQAAATPPPAPSAAPDASAAPSAAPEAAPPATAAP
jgi:hypothetical protein